MYVSKSYLVPNINIIKRYVFVVVQVYVIRMSIMSRITYHNKYLKHEYTYLYRGVYIGSVTVY